MSSVACVRACVRAHLNEIKKKRPIRCVCVCPILKSSNGKVAKVSLQIDVTNFLILLLYQYATSHWWQQWQRPSSQMDKRIGKETQHFQLSKRIYMFANTALYSNTVYASTEMETRIVHRTEEATKKKYSNQRRNTRNNLNICVCNYKENLENVVGISFCFLLNLNRLFWLHRNQCNVSTHIRTWPFFFFFVRMEEKDQNVSILWE